VEKAEVTKVVGIDKKESQKVEEAKDKDKPEVVKKTAADGAYPDATVTSNPSKLPLPFFQLHICPIKASPSFFPTSYSPP
jgi:hypothetical protein